MAIVIKRFALTCKLTDSYSNDQLFLPVMIRSIVFAPRSNSFRKVLAVERVTFRAVFLQGEIDTDDNSSDAIIHEVRGSPAFARQGLSDKR
jgi:hypothetical protein